jgi:hypothetical protein
MSKTSFIIGLTVSLLIHGVLLLQGQRKKEIAYKKVRQEPKRVANLILPPPPVVNDIPKEKPKEQPPEQNREPAVEELKKVVNPPETKVTEESGDFSEIKSDDYVPELRLVWDNPGQLIQVAKALGMRILLIDTRNKPVGELLFDKDLLVKEFKGRLTNFSNRVRTISAEFFGPEVQRQSDESIKCFWIVVPASVDQVWITLQKQAIKSKGISYSEVSYVEARIAPNGDSYELVVTRVVTL